LNARRLNRFTYNRKTWVREKVKKRFGFPSRLDIGKFCTKDGPARHESHAYILFSVVIHIGGAGSGHYIALARDTNGEGTWVKKVVTGSGGASKPTQKADSMEWTTVVTKKKASPTEGGSDSGGGGGGGSDGDIGTADIGGGPTSEPDEINDDAAWFLCNDSTVSCAGPDDIEEIFGGERCGYMLMCVRCLHLTSTSGR
jgi:hypothetical protein